MNPQRSLKGKLATSVFYQQYNEVDIYIEDMTTGAAKLYKNIFKRVFEGNKRLEKVFELGGRENVIEACRNDNDSNDRARIYIIDGDLKLRSFVKYDKCFTLNVDLVEKKLATVSDTAMEEVKKLFCNEI